MSNLEFERAEQRARKNAINMAQSSAHNMNALYGHQVSAVMTEEEKQRYKACPNYALKRPGAYYLTDLEGSECEMLAYGRRPVANHIEPFKWRFVDLDKFRQDCEEIEDE